MIYVAHRDTAHIRPRQPNLSLVLQDPRLTSDGNTCPAIRYDVYAGILRRFLCLAWTDPIDASAGEDELALKHAYLSRFVMHIAPTGIDKHFAECLTDGGSEQRLLTQLPPWQLGGDG